MWLKDLMSFIFIYLLFFSKAADIFKIMGNVNVKKKEKNKQTGLDSRRIRNNLSSEFIKMKPFSPSGSHGH